MVVYGQGRKLQSKKNLSRCSRRGNFFLRQEAAALEGKRGGKTAAKKADDQARREQRRLVTEGWVHVLDGAASVHADALAVSIGAERAVRHEELLPRLREVGHPEQRVALENCLQEIQRVRAGFGLNPLADLWVEGMLDRLAMIRQGSSIPRRSPGALTSG